ncbi:9976_t:CDS:1, partial [Cetraspora pellucida]
VHISDFVCESIGRLRLSEEQQALNASLPNSIHLKYTEACVIMHPGSNHDGWWTNVDIVKKVKE